MPPSAQQLRTAIQKEKLRRAIEEAKQVQQAPALPEESLAQVAAPDPTASEPTRLEQDLERYGPRAVELPDLGMIDQAQANPVLPPDQSELERTGRAGTVMTGSMVGAARGVPGGPAGIVIGGALGAGFGYLTYEAGLDALRLSGVEGLSPQPTTIERLQTAGKEAMIDMAFPLGLKVGGEVMSAGNALLGGMVRKGITGVGNGLRKAGVAEFSQDMLEQLRVYLDRSYAKMLGVTETGMEQSEIARQLGVDVGIVQASEGRLVRLWSKVLGQFPFLAGKARPRMLRAQQQALEAHDRLFLQVGPSMGMAEIGIDLNKAATGTFNRFRDAINVAYKDAFDFADSVGATVPTTGLKWHARRHKTALLSRYGDSIRESDIFKFFDEEVEALADDIPFERYKGLADQLDRTMTIAKQDSYNVHSLSVFKLTAMERALTNVSDPRVKTLIEEADGKFARLMTELFETPTATRFGRIEKHRFKVDIKPPEKGTVYPDQAFKVVFQQQRDSAQAMLDLRKLVGEGNLRHATRRYIDAQWARQWSVTPEGGEVFSTEAFRKTMGLHDPKGGQWAALEEAMRGTGVSPQDLKNLTDTIDLTLRNVPADVNAFIARRGVLGGWKSVLAAAAPVLAAGGGGFAAGGLDVSIAGVTSTVGLLMLSRQFGRIVSTPRTYAAAMKLLDENTTFQVKRNALMTLVRTLDPEMADRINTPEGLMESFDRILTTTDESTAED